MKSNPLLKIIIYIGFAIGPLLTVYGAFWLYVFSRYPTMMGEPITLSTYLFGFLLLVVGILITVASYLSFKKLENASGRLILLEMLRVLGFIPIALGVYRVVSMVNDKMLFIGGRWQLPIFLIFWGVAVILVSHYFVKIFRGIELLTRFL